MHYICEAPLTRSSSIRTGKLHLEFEDKPESLEEKTTTTNTPPPTGSFFSGEVEQQTSTSSEDPVDPHKQSDHQSSSSHQF